LQAAFMLEMLITVAASFFCICCFIPVSKALFSKIGWVRLSRPSKLYGYKPPRQPLINIAMESSHFTLAHKNK
jgi:hypothetical protein